MSEFDPFELSSGEADRASEEAHRLRQLEDDSDLSWLIADFRGRRFVRRLLERAGVFRSSFTGDPLTSAFREGERNIGLELLASAIRTAPAQLGTILTEEARG